MSAIEEIKVETVEEELMTPEQLAAFNWFKDSNDSSLVLLGAGGTGKSFVFKKLVQYCKLRNFEIAVTATTGVAANLVGGVTLHSALGLGLAKDSDKAEDHMFSRQAKQVWEKIDVLFIDEISMLSGILFEKLDYHGRSFRDPYLPFGGIRLVLSGDFLQLGPVSKTGIVYAFETDAWNRIFSKDDIFVFEKSIRQLGDQRWSKILQNIRVGKKTNEDFLLLASRKSVKDFDKDAVKIYCKNVDVDYINRSRLDAMIKSGAESRTYTARFEPPEARLYKGTVPDAITLCVGARVMCTINVKGYNLFNGSMGMVKHVSPESVVVDYDNGETHKHDFYSSRNDVNVGSARVEMTMHHIPLRLCWASTVHKIQGATLDGGRVHVENAFAPGQVYVALSRFKTLDGICLEGFSPNAVRTCRRCLEFYESIKN